MNNKFPKNSNLYSCISIIPYYNFDFTMNKSKENMEGDKNYNYRYLNNQLFKNFKLNEQFEK